ncbi:malonyl-[acyl-carrier protein] O-methyltransferase [Anaerolineaceae bacterium]|nr:malonyl-[acyl-carrier protein] O-methyltransferase [Anaerolineaceae bacterium]
MTTSLPNTQLAAYRQAREPKHHELRLLELLIQRAPELRCLLDIGCASGAFIQLIRPRFAAAKFTGIDISAELIELAKKKFEADPNCSFYVQDALAYTPQNKYDVIIASGVLSIFEDFEEPLSKWLSWLESNGTLYLFGCFNSRNIDTINRFRNHYVGGAWEGGLTSYSITTVGNFLTAKGYSHEFIRFHLPISISEADDPIRSFTLTTSSGQMMVLNGANIITELYYLIVHDTKAND